MYRWELDSPAQQELADLPPAARASLAAFMDAVVIVDPVQYQRRHDDRADSKGLNQWERKAIELPEERSKLSAS